MKKRGRKQAKTDIKKVNAQNSKFWCPECQHESCRSGQNKANVVDRLSSDRKLNTKKSEENTDQHIDSEAPSPAPSIWVRKEIFKSEALLYNSNIIVSSVNFDFESQ